jgi:hypothetical protein
MLGGIQYLFLFFAENLIQFFLQVRAQTALIMTAFMLCKTSAPSKAYRLLQAK